MASFSGPSLGDYYGSGSPGLSSGFRAGASGLDITQSQVQAQVGTNFGVSGNPLMTFLGLILILIILRLLYEFAE